MRKLALTIALFTAACVSRGAVVVNSATAQQGSAGHKFGVFNNGPLPGPGLYAVSHDATMSGSGTQLSPLSSPGSLAATTQTLTPCTTTQTDIALSATTTVLRVNATSGGCQLLGIAAPSSGQNRFLWVVNSGTAVLTVVHESASEATTANRLNTTGAVSTPISFMGPSGFNGGMLMFYDQGTSR